MEKEKEDVWIPFTPTKHFPSRPGLECDPDFSISSYKGAQTYTNGIANSIEFAVSGNSSYSYGPTLGGLPKISFMELLAMADAARRYDKPQEEMDKDEIPRNDDEKSNLASPTVETPSVEHNTNKRGRVADVNKKPQQRPRMKKHRPKVVVEGKPKKTPKPSNLQPQTPKLSTPKRATPKESPHEKRKYVRKNIVKPGFDTSAEYAAKSCKRVLKFDLENQAKDENNNNLQASTNSLEAVDPNPEYAKKSCSRALDFNLDNGFLESESLPNITAESQGKEHMVENLADMAYGFTKFEECIQTEYMPFPRIFQENQCLENSRNLGLNFPRICKKKRMKRKKAIEILWPVTATEDFQNQVKALIKSKSNPKRIQKGVRNSEVYCNLPIVISNPLIQYEFVQMISPTNKQANAAINDPDSFKCVLTLSPIVKSRRKRSKGVTRRLDLSSRTANPAPVEFDARSRDEFVDKLIDFTIQRLECLHINNKCGQLVVRDQKAHGALVPYEGKFDPSKKRKSSPKVDLDPETMRVWKLLMENDGSEVVEEEDKDKEKWWEEQREIFRGRVDSFIARMHLIQGDRRFSPWKGSVLDSVGGAYLTQNVSDHLSSCAFMTLVARFPLPSTSNYREYDDGTGNVCSQESVGSNIGEDGKANDTNDKQSFACRTEQDLSHQFAEFREETTIESSTTFTELLQLEETDFLQKFYSHENEKLSHNESPVDGNKVSGGMENENQTPGSKRKKNKVEEKQENPIDWDDLRKAYFTGRTKESSANTMDSLDWEAVRRAKVEEVSKTILGRGMNNIIGTRIKEFLDRMVKDHGSMDLEWLRDVPPDKAKEFLLSIRGLGLKSVECIRLLTLHHIAFPVDTNVGRVAVRLGWVPLRPLPEEIQIHLLNQYPMVDTIQKYLWPRLCTLDQRTLYELHYQLITFGKVFCTKRKPNCNACPMRGECRHFASAFASARLALPGPQEKSIVTSKVPVPYAQNPDVHIRPPTLYLNDIDISGSRYQTQNCEPIIEVPASPEREQPPETLRDIEDLFSESDDEIPTIRLNGEDITENLRDYMDRNNILLEDGDMSKALVVLTNEAASIPLRRLKYVSRLRTEHQVYELPDSHPLLARLNKRELDDPCPYLLAIWTTGETVKSPEQPEKRCNSQESEVCFSCSNIEEQNIETICGTILIPCRTAMGGSFPLNGTYFQVNEVFADDESSERPINVPREWIWNLPRRTIYCGTTATTIFRGLSMKEIQNCFWRGFICVRGFNRTTGLPRRLAKRFHISTTAGGKTKAAYDE